MGLADVRSLANTLQVAKQTGMDMGSQLALKPYPKERYTENHLMLSATDHLHQIFGARNGVINWLRGTGLDVINEVGWVKKVFMAGAGAGVRTGNKGVKRDVNGDESSGWPGLLASAVESSGQIKGVVSGIASMAGQAVRSGLSRGPSRR